MKRRKPYLLLPLLLALPTLLTAAAACIWLLPELNDWLAAAVKVAILP
ncbi:MAG: hypothetical protein IKO83_12140 [Oscillospiraceae bacterium]|nr:hypothetical protein [Oscillospiraceae bacterium]